MLKRRNNFGKRGRKIKLSPLERIFFEGSIVRFNRDGTLICQIPHHICPKSVMVRLTYPDTVSIRTHSTSIAGNWSIRSSAYDPDPSFGTGAIPGFAEWSVFYQNYRVHGIGVRGQVCNGEAFPMVVVFRPYTGSLVTNNTYTTVTDVDEEGGNSLAWSGTLAAISGALSCQKVNQFWHLSEVHGSDQWLTDDGYTCAVTTNPGATINILGSYCTLSGANMAIGLYTHLEFDMDIEFYGRKKLTT